MASASITVALLAAVRLNFCVPCLRPPTKKDAPSTSSRLPMMLPVSDALTISTWCARSATTAMISSAALPKVALRKPPSVGPDRLASSSVASPINPAAGMSEMAAARTATARCRRVSARNQLMGATISSRFSQLPVKDVVNCRAKVTRDYACDGTFAVRQVHSSDKLPLWPRRSCSSSSMPRRRTSCARRSGPGGFRCCSGWSSRQPCTRRRSSIFPSITPAATSSIITGAYPAEHGIAGASWYDSARKEVAYYGDDFWVIAREGFGDFLSDFLLRLNGDRLKAPTLFEMIERAGRRAACLNYLVFKGDSRHTVNMPGCSRRCRACRSRRRVDGPSILCLGDFVAPTCRRGQKLDEEGRACSTASAWTTRPPARCCASSLARDALPDFTVAYFADNDYVSHEVGPVAALPVLERVDRMLGEAFDAAGGIERVLADTVRHRDVGPRPLRDARRRRARRHPSRPAARPTSGRRSSAAVAAAATRS